MLDAICHVTSRCLAHTSKKLSPGYTQTTWQHHHQVTIYTDTTAQTMFSVLPYVTEKLFDELLVIQEQTPL